MRKVVEYKVISMCKDKNCIQCQDLTFENKINSYLKQGWQPIGGLACCSDTFGTLFIGQAMVKYEEEVVKKSLTTETAKNTVLSELKKQIERHEGAINNMMKTLETFYQTLPVNALPLYFMQR